MNNRLVTRWFEMNREQQEQIKQDVRAVEHAKNDETAKDAALLLRNDLYRVGEHSRTDRKQALDLVNRTNIYDRAENPNLPKITLINDDTFPNVKSGTELRYKDRTVVEGYKPQQAGAEKAQGNKDAEKPKAESQKERPSSAPVLASERDR